MPHAVEEEEEDEDDELLNRVLREEQLEALDDIHTRALDIGEKANDAEDFEDIGDDDLPDEEEEEGSLAAAPPIQGDFDDELGLLNDDAVEEDPFDDLFNANDMKSSPPPGDESNDIALDAAQTSAGNNDRTRSLSQESFTAEDTFYAQEQDDMQVEEEEEEEEDEETREQRLLFAQAKLEREERGRRADNLSGIPPAPQTDAELFSIVWPQFESDRPPRFGALLPGKRAYYLSRTPLKPPKPVQPTKVSLELQQDQEKAFKLTDTSAVDFGLRQAEARAKGVVLLDDEVERRASNVNESALEGLDEEEDNIGGLSWRDIVVVCEDWDVPSYAPSNEGDEMDVDLVETVDEDDWNLEAEARPSKRRKLTDASSLRQIHNLDVLFEDPEKATQRLARTIQLDLNDPLMLVDVQPSNVAQQQRKSGAKISRDAVGGFTKSLHRKYNISNDEAYNLLKENHQSKIRSTLGNLSIEHAVPAIKLQYPFYKVKLSAREARAFHRPALLGVMGTVYFDKPHHIKTKTLKGKDVQSMFARSSDLTLADNSKVLLLEYSEEYPAMLSGFGMGSRLINYYRRKDNEDQARPKLNVGETAVLLPQDKSPFAIFGDVDPGQITPTIHNGMYRAPVFKHEADPRDFLVVRSSTGVDGAKWYIRNIENLHVVGQEFPSVEVPGTHSRKVTDAAKKRLRMLSYRIFKKNTRAGKAAALKNDMILKHLPGSDIPQNRSKMREFMDYDKDRGWLPRKNEVVPDEATIRSWLKPEDVCLLDSMQVGDRQLQDAGYNRDVDEDEKDDDEEKEGQSLDQQLAPWQTSKNFLNACQGKAMLQLHGEGDPTGRGEAFNFIRTSMKGGFREIGESVEDRLDAKRLKELGGHSYNVARQQKAYTDAIRRIWEAQRLSLSSSATHDDTEMEDAAEQTGGSGRAETPASALPRARRDDETGSVFSKGSTGSQNGKTLKITRYLKNKHGHEEVSTETVTDHKVIREYMRRRRQLDLASLSLGDVKRTGDEEFDQRQQKFLFDELARLERNKGRRLARDKAKGINTSAGSPDASGSPGPDGSTPAPTGSGRRGANAGGTQRKCANCGQVGHIKTNKKLCPLLNGTIKQDEGFGESAFASISGAATALTAPGPLGGGDGFGS